MVCIFASTSFTLNKFDMIIFGTGSKTIATEKANDFSCTSCQNETLYAVIIARYFHIFWIPFFPIGKKLYLSCSHCKKVSEHNISSLSQKHRDMLGEDFLNKSGGASVWIGGIIIAGLILFGMISSLFH